MKQAFHFLVSILVLSNLSPAQAQEEVRAAGDKMPEMRKTATAITPVTYKGRQVVVSSGGGITGASTTYYLFENGKLFGKRSADKTFAFIGQQTAVNTKGVFATVEVNCKIKTTKFDTPGNLYKSVQWRKGKLSYKVTWDAVGKTTVPPNYPRFYDSFMAMIPASLRLK